MRLDAAARAAEEDAGQFWKDFIRETAPVFRKPTIEQLEGFIAPTFQALVDGAQYVDERLVEIIDELQPDVIVEDNVVSLPALPASGRPWVRIVSCNPAEMKDADVPPTFSGYPSDDGRAGRPTGTSTGAPTRELHAGFDEFCRERGAPPLPELEFIHSSPFLNLLSTRTRWTTARASPLGGDLAQPRGQRPRHRRGLGAAERRRRRAARLPQPRLARLRRRRADARPDRLAGATRPTA